MKGGQMKRCLLSFVCCCLALACSSLLASTTTIGPSGINSAGLTLANGNPMNGGGVGLAIPAVTIGQVELTRPGESTADGGFDDDAHSSRDVVPYDVFRRTTSGSSIANLYTDDHPEEVASVMIGKDMIDPDGGGPMVPPTGVALGATLYSAATDPPAPPYSFYDQDAAVTTANLISSSVSMRAINMSFYNPLQAGHTKYDGNEHLTQYIDWSASNDNILYVVAGDEGHASAVPSDNFNGITVASSSLDNGVYRRVSSFNTQTNDADGDRTSIGLLAPGDAVDMTALNNVATSSGTSFAAPHVTAAVALLQQYNNERSSALGTGWAFLSGQRH